MRRYLLILIFVAFCASVNAADDGLDKVKFPSPKLGKKPIKQQVRLALKTYTDMSEADQWDIQVFIDGHYIVINDCPDTAWAIESCWRLSNLLLTGTRNRDYNEIVRLMELALDNYPVNPWKKRFQNRLLTVLQDTKNNEKLMYWSQKFLKTTDPDTQTYLSLCLTAGKAAIALGDHKSADIYFSEILKRDKKKTSIFTKIAQSYVAK